jgi:hypothetical protein
MQEMVNVYQAKILAEWEAEMKAYRLERRANNEEMMTMFDAHQERMMVCLGKMETRFGC